MKNFLSMTERADLTVSNYGTLIQRCGTGSVVAVTIYYGSGSGSGSGSDF
jgi:hypothetical protein